MNRALAIIAMLLVYSSAVWGQGMSPYGWAHELRENGRHFEFEFDYDLPEWRTETYRDQSARPEIIADEPQVITWHGPEEPGTIVIETASRQLFFVLDGEEAFLYPIAVGREGFAWTGTERVSRIEQWPDWIPPAEMRARRPELPERMKGGINNPLGAVAIYLGNSLYRIHGTNDPKSIGKAESSGCFRMLNEHVMHLSQIVEIGTLVIVR